MSDELEETGTDGWDETEPETVAESEPEVAAETEAAKLTPPERTGVSTVDAAVERLAELDDLPTGEHVAIYDAVHRQLQDALADFDGA